MRIMLTAECSNNCSYCYVKSSPGYQTLKHAELNKELAEKQLKELNVCGYELIGGEPFQRPDLIEWFLNWNKENGNKPVTFFTSGIGSSDEVFELLKEYTALIQVNFSYDGSLSDRNKNNHKFVQYVIKKFQRLFPVSVRFGVSPEDIPNVFIHFKEIFEMGVQMPIFFPFKYADYTPEDIQLFVNQFTKVLDYCAEKNINLFHLLTTGNIVTGSAKRNFQCTDEMCLLPNNKFTKCYVAYTSSGYDNELVNQNINNVKPLTIENNNYKCAHCLDLFGGCNKCPGNLLQYQRLTGKQMWYSYCELINALANAYLDAKKKYCKGWHYEFANMGNKPHCIVEG